jgi:urea transporter
MQYIKLYFRGAAQVMFQRNALSGVIMLLGIFWGAVESNTPMLGWAALVGLLSSTIAGMIVCGNRNDAAQGLYGFNGVLVGCAFAAFFDCRSWQIWVSLVLCAAATSWLRDALNRWLKPMGVNSLTMPFVLMTWVFMFAARQFGIFAHNGLDHPMLTAHTSLPFVPTQINLYIGWIKGISQVFLVDAVGTGIFFIVALAVNSGWAALWAAVGSAVGMGVAILFGADGTAIAQGMYGYSTVLTAIALGCTFYRPSWRAALWCLPGIVLTAFVQAAMYSLMLPYGLATLTAPFCLTTWMFASRARK